MYNLKKRHVRGVPYTRTGDIVIACNPYKWYHELYSEEKRHWYAQRLVWQRNYKLDVVKDIRSTMPPHVYEASSLAYRGLAADGEDQSILVSGESGAGKTETVKILLSDLASVQTLCTSRALTKHGAGNEDLTSPIVQRVLDSNPLLEAFGNAKTVRNDNSSRFGKYLSLQFDCEDPVRARHAGKVVPSCILAGSKCEVYLLEKSRVVHHEDDERTYHIFYQLLAADDDVKATFWTGLENTDNESFAYVGYTETDTIEGKTDAERFQMTLDSLSLIGIQGEKLKMLIRAICIVLQLGNLMFEADEGEGSIITSEEEFTELAELMGISEAELTAALTIRTMTTNNETYKVPIKPLTAKDSVDAFAKEIYSKTFLWLVRSINDATSAERNYHGNPNLYNDRFGLIGLLDIFGFETFETNRFEQLCINYANEKLQQKFTEDIFQSVQAEYEYEGIELDEITYDDNTDVLDLVEGRMGLLAFLNEECVRPGGNDKGFVSKALAMNKHSPAFVVELHHPETFFGIVHYAGTVIYDAENFVTKNMDTLPSDLQDCAKLSTNGILAKEMSNESTMNDLGNTNTAGSAAARKKKRRPPRKAAVAAAKKKPYALKKMSSNIIGSTVWTKFKEQLCDLMVSLKATRTRYIRCIKPNDFKKPLIMQHVPTVQQLRCAGVVAAVTISRSAFPNRLEHEVVLERFKSLWKLGHYEVALRQAEDDDEDPEVVPRKLVTSLLTTALKALEVRPVEDGIEVIKAFVIGRTRAYFRAGALEYLEAERLRKLGTSAIIIQNRARTFMARSKYLKLRKAAMVLQSITRKCIAQSLYRHLRRAAILVECWYRRMHASRTLIILRKNFKATLIQTRWRMITAMAVLKEYRTASLVVQTMVRGALQRPKFRDALHQKKEDAKLENQLVALQKKLEEAENRRIESEKLAEEKAQQMVKEIEEKQSQAAAALEDAVEDEKKEQNPTDANSFQSAISEMDGDGASLSSKSQTVSATIGQLSEQQQTLMDESGKMLEYLRKEVFKLRSQNAQMRTDFDLLKDNNQRLMDANASAGASFAALNQHAKQLSRTNDKLSTSLASCKHQVQKLSVIQVELKEELKMKQATYVAEVHSRLQYQKSMAKIVDIVQETCNDTRLVENVLNIADDCETEFMNASTLGNEQEQSPPNIQSDNNPVNSPNPITPLKSEKSLMSKFVGSFWG